MNLNTKTTFLILLLTILTSNIYSQSLDFGVTSLVNFSSHTNYNPLITEDGKFQWNNLTTFGFGVYVKKNFKRRFGSKLDLIYQGKGYTEIAQTGLIGPGGTPTSYNTLQNKLNYLSVISSLNYVVLNKTNFKLLGVIGLEQNLLVKRNLESEKIWPIYEFYPVNRYSDNWRKYSLNYQIGLGLSFQEKVVLNPFFSRNLTPALKVEDLVVKDWIWGIRIDLSIYNTFIKKV